MDSEIKLIMKKIAYDAAEQACDRIMTQMGLDVNDPIEAQKDFIALRELRKLFSSEDVQKDFTHIRTWRLRMETVEKHSLIAFVSAGVLVLIGVVWTGLKSKIGM